MPYRDNIPFSAINFFNSLKKFHLRNQTRKYRKKQIVKKSPKGAHEYPKVRKF